MPAIKHYPIADLILFSVLLWGCAASPRPSQPALFSEITPTHRAKVSKEEAFVTLYPFEMNTFLHLQTNNSLYELGAFPTNVVDYGVVNRDKNRAVWFPNAMLNEKILIYGLQKESEWFEVPMTVTVEETPPPMIIGPLPQFNPLGGGSIFFPTEVVSPTTATEIRIVIWGYILGSDGKPTKEAVGAYTDVTVVDKR